MYMPVAYKLFAQSPLPEVKMADEPRNLSQGKWRSFKPFEAIHPVSRGRCILESLGLAGGTQGAEILQKPCPRCTRLKKNDDRL